MLTIKELPKSQRPRERLLEVGPSNLSDIEILAILLKTGYKEENVMNVATNILKKIGTINNLKNFSCERLMKFKGVGQAKAIELLASIELGRRIFLKEESSSTLKFNNSSIIYKMNKHLFKDKKQEYFYCLYLDTKKHLIERKLLFMGTVNRSFVHPREIFKEAYLLSASSIICMHNHPTGDPTPSNDDIMLTQALLEIGKLQQIPIVDHIIFGDNTYYSFYENNINMR